jgi:hypothetical protein
MGKKSDRIKQSSVSDAIRVAILKELEDGHTSIVSELEAILVEVQSIVANTDAIADNTDGTASAATTSVFSFPDGTIHDATIDAVSTSLVTIKNSAWSINPIVSGLSTDKPEYTIQVSNDNISWFDYNNNSNDVKIEDAVDDNHLSWVYIRISYDHKTESTGTVRFVLIQKEKYFG